MQEFQKAVRSDTHIHWLYLCMDNQRSSSCWYRRSLPSPLPCVKCLKISFKIKRKENEEEKWDWVPEWPLENHCFKQNTKLSALKFQHSKCSRYSIRASRVSRDLLVVTTHRCDRYCDVLHARPIETLRHYTAIFVERREVLEYHEKFEVKLTMEAHFLVLITLKRQENWFLDWRVCVFNCIDRNM